MEKKISKSALSLFFIIALIVGCSKQENINNEYVLQIKNVGLRQGVFVRRYKLTRDYGQNNTFTPEILKKFIKQILEPDYLFIQDAYNKGMHKENLTRQKIQEYRINLLSNNHPIYTENIFLSNEELYDIYQKKTIKYDLEIVQTNSYYEADSIYRSLIEGNEFKKANREMGFSFPQYLQYQGITYGEQLPPELFDEVTTMEQGKISPPLYTPPVWSVIKLNKKNNNPGLKSFEDIKKDLIGQGQFIKKQKNINQYLETLKKKYPINVKQEYFPSLINAYTFIDKDHGWLDYNKFSPSDLFIKIGDNEITITDFIYSFNSANGPLRYPRLTEQDISKFVENYVSQYLLYLDALEKGVDKDSFIKDQLENKEHRILLNKYLKEELYDKLTISEDEVRKYYHAHSHRWKAEYQDIKNLVKNELRNKLLNEKKKKLSAELSHKYGVKYNEPLLQELANQLTSEKKSDKANDCQTTIK